MKIVSRASKRYLEMTRKLDQLGLASSLFCGIHCAITPIAISLFLSFGVQKAFLSGWENIDLICLSVAPFVAFFSLRDGFIHHRVKLPIVIFLCGFAVLVSGYCLSSVNEVWHRFFMACGGLVVASSHFVNLKLLMNLHKDCFHDAQ